ncbi:MAG TPA: four helix bundle protein [Vicinamibacterales bacterium]|nr:four helix bundle protein [Vicinamibacterales bacterium]
MTPDDLKVRTKQFAVDVVRFAKTIPKDHINDEIASQLTDAATSTAAHYRAVCRPRSRADFIHKLSGAVEEVDESRPEFWSARAKRHGRGGTRFSREINDQKSTINN